MPIFFPLLFTAVIKNKAKLEAFEHNKAKNVCCCLLEWQNEAGGSLSQWFTMPLSDDYGKHSTKQQLTTAALGEAQSPWQRVCKGRAVVHLMALKSGEIFYFCYCVGNGHIGYPQEIFCKISEILARHYVIQVLRFFSTSAWDCSASAWVFSFLLGVPNVSYDQNSKYKMTVLGVFSK